jgi:hypothetical protein
VHSMMGGLHERESPSHSTTTQAQKTRHTILREQVVGNAAVCGRIAVALVIGVWASWALRDVFHCVLIFAGWVSGAVARRATSIDGMQEGFSYNST